MSESPKNQSTQSHHHFSRSNERLLSERKKLKRFATGGVINTKSLKREDVITAKCLYEELGSPIMSSHFSEGERLHTVTLSFAVGDVTNEKVYDYLVKNLSKIIDTALNEKP